MQKIRSEKNLLALNKNYDQFYDQDTLNKTLVLIISESVNKQHMSLYGYERNTTPFLDDRRDLYVFKDCVTPAVLTVDAVPALFFNEDDTKDLNLITLLNKLGYETVWISNQSGWEKKMLPSCYFQNSVQKAYLNGAWPKTMNPIQILTTMTNLLLILKKY